MADEADDGYVDTMPAPINAALAFLDYCRLRQCPFDIDGVPHPATLDLDEMRAREAALDALGHYFRCFSGAAVTQTFEQATALAKAAAAQAEADEAEGRAGLTGRRPRGRSVAWSS